MFSPWARRLIAVAAIVVGLVLALAASDQGDNRKLVISLVFFAIAAANLLPPRIAKWFAKFVALVIVLFCAYVVVESWTGTSQDKYMSVKMCLLLGVPALLYLVVGLLPYEFGRKRPDNFP
jgi:peptidoglycan/LPS O-acetylase OafA/YrhL